MRKVAAALWLVVMSMVSGWPGDARSADARPLPLAGEPFQLVGGYLVVVKGSIGDLRDLTFLVDTGAGRTVIHRGIADALGLARTREDLLAFGQRTSAELAVTPSLTLGPVQVIDLPVLVADLALFGQRVGVEVDAVVGMDMLRHGCFTIDYVNTTLTFACRPDLPARAALLPAHLLPVVEASIDGSTYRLVVDSGAEAIILFAHAIPRRARVQIDAEVQAYHLAGLVRLKRFTPRSFLIGSQRLGSPPVFILEGERETPGFDGVIAMRWLRSAQVHLDLARRLVSWGPPAR